MVLGCHTGQQGVWFFMIHFFFVTGYRSCHITHYPSQPSFIHCHTMADSGDHEEQGAQDGHNATAYHGEDLSELRRHLPVWQQQVQQSLLQAPTAGVQVVLTSQTNPVSLIRFFKLMSMDQLAVCFMEASVASFKSALLKQGPARAYLLLLPPYVKGATREGLLAAMAQLKQGYVSHGTKQLLMEPPHVWLFTAVAPEDDPDFVLWEEDTQGPKT
jgi:hypothetical protein